MNKKIKFIFEISETKLYFNVGGLSKHGILQNKQKLEQGSLF